MNWGKPCVLLVEKMGTIFLILTSRGLFTGFTQGFPQFIHRKPSWNSVYTPFEKARRAKRGGLFIPRTVENLWKKGLGVCPLFVLPFFSVLGFFYWFRFFLGGHFFLYLLKNFFKISRKFFSKFFL